MDLLGLSKKNSTSQFLMQSVIMKDAQTYNKLKDLYDYLDLHKDSLLREVTKQPSGLRNLGNTCYLNVLLQVLFHINYLRDKICNAMAPQDKFINALRRLFGSMGKSKFIFSDPTQVFNALIKAYPDVFGPGIQNDFQQVFTLLVDQLEKSFVKISEQDSRALQKIFYGKMTVETTADKRYTRGSKFSVINLDVKQNNLEKALQAFKNYEIDQFNTEKGKTMKATATTTFVQTPALIAFFINRVFFQNGLLKKDQRNFGFNKQIYFAKKNTKNTQNMQQKIRNVQKQIEELENWKVKIREIKENLIKSISYLDSKQFNLIIHPVIQNPLGEKGLKSSKQYLEVEVAQIDKKFEQAEESLKRLAAQKGKLQLQHDSQIYNIYAVMIHQGKAADSGHYKVCINTNDDQWIQFNDRKVSSISLDKIQEYKKDGKICCLFYRRTTLACSAGKIVVSASLKKQVAQRDQKLKSDIDNARVSQTIYAATQTAGLLVQSERNNAKANLPYYFFKPNISLICEGKSYQVCKNAILKQTLDNFEFEEDLRSKLFNKQRPILFPIIQLDLPESYKQISEKLNKVLILQRQLLKVPKAYEQLQKLSHFSPKKQLIEAQFTSTIGIIFMKGVFYYQMFIEYNFVLQSKSLYKSLNSIITNMNEKTEFLFTYFPIISELNSTFQRNIGHGQIKQYARKAVVKKVPIQAMTSYAELFSRRFSTWIRRAQNIGQVYQQTVKNDRKMHHEYLDFSIETKDEQI